MSYVLVLWCEDPVSSSVVHKKRVKGVLVTGEKSLVEWHGKELLALIIRTGTLKELSNVKVCADGEIWDENRGPESPAVQSRQTIIDERRRKNVTYRKVADAQRDHFLYRLTFQGANEDNDLDDAAEEPDDNVPNFRLLRTAEDMIKALPQPLTKICIEALVTSLPCLRKEHENNDEMKKLSPKHDVFVNSKIAWGYSKVYRDDAKKLFEQLLMECVPEVVLALPYISASGTKGTVGIPQDIKLAATYYANVNSTSRFSSGEITKAVNNLLVRVRKDPKIKSKLEALLQ